MRSTDMKCRLVVLSVALAVSGLVAYTLHLKSAPATPMPPATVVSTRSNDLPQVFHKQLSNEEKQHVLDVPFAVVASVEAMPQDVRRAFATITGEHEFALANPGQRYQVTDVIVESGLPFERLVFAGRSGDTWFVHYEHGGRGHSYAVIVFEPDPQGGVRFVWGGVGFDRAKDLQDLRRLIATGRFHDDRAYYW